MIEKTIAEFGRIDILIDNGDPRTMEDARNRLRRNHGDLVSRASPLFRPSGDRRRGRYWCEGKPPERPIYIDKSVGRA